MISIIHPTRDTLEFAYRQPTRFANANLTRLRSQQMRPRSNFTTITTTITIDRYYSTFVRLKLAAHNENNRRAACGWSTVRIVRRLIA
ncbi:hypothetical protein Y032_0125g1284 [Ancylostoma ceylanicum]|uniref:Uncharacterized protein n=1 Tax=Ancylostoma ceylanicum TaxID=53326 RepID=A0A016T928_9BILA|nr:hypothetical protein Y032_0125g1284 [Ancylostoma ceylanicum]